MSASDAPDLIARINGLAEGARPACPGAPVLVLATFATTVADAATVGAKVRDMYGEAGPSVLVQTIVEAEGQVWRRPATGWAAEKGGDAHVFTLRVYIPARARMNKITTSTVRWTMSTGVVTVQGIKANLVEYAGPWTQAFGRVAAAGVLGPSVEAPPQASLERLWRQR